MKTPFQKNLLLSAGLHVAALGTCLLLLGFARPEKLPEHVQWLDMSVSQPAPAPVPAETPPEQRTETPMPPAPPPPPQEPPQAAKETEPVKSETPLETPTPQPEPPPLKEPSLPKKIETKPAVKKSAPEKPKIKISAKVVVRTIATASPSKRTAPSVSTSDIQKELFAALKQKGGPISIGSATDTGNGKSIQENSKYGWYYELIRQAMTSAWHQPMGMAENAQAVISIRIEQDGTISTVSLKDPSGDQQVDASVLQAANRVKKLAPPPPELGTPAAEITVTFKPSKS